MHKWGDFLTRITVGPNGEQCKTLVAGESYLVVGLADSKGSFVLYPTDTFEEVRRCQHGEHLSAMSMNRQGSQLVTGGLKFNSVWDLQSGAMVGRIENHTGARCLALGFRSDDETILSVASDEILTIWNASKHVQECVSLSQRPQRDGGYRFAPCGASIDAGGTRVAVAYEGRPMAVWDIEKRELITTLGTHNPVGSCFNPMNDNIYEIDRDGTFKCKDCRCGTEGEIKAPSNVIICNPSGTLVATGNSQGRVNIYYAASTLHLLHTLSEFDGSVSGVAFSPNGSRLYDIRDSYCTVWMPDVEHLDHPVLVSKPTRLDNVHASGTPSAVPQQSPEAVTILACHPTSAHISCGTTKGKVKLYDSLTGREECLLYEHAPTVSIKALVWSYDGTTIASGDNAGRIIAASLPPQESQTSWGCRTILDLCLDPGRDGCIRQLLIDPGADRLLVHAQLGTRMFLLGDGSEVGARQTPMGGGTPAWITHPKDDEKIIVIGCEKARIYAWNSFSNLPPNDGMALERKRPMHGGPWKQVSGEVRTSARASADGDWIITTDTVW
jgi:WD40 repeat protein